MNRYVIGSLWDRDNRNGANKNFEYLFEGSNRVTELNKRADSILSESNATLNEAKQTNDMNKDVQKQVDDLIIHAGESDAEVIQARGDAPLLKDRLDKTDSQLAKTETYVANISKDTNSPFEILTKNNTKNLIPNADTPLNIPTYDGSNQTTHPSVLYFKDGWNGYKFWMCHTPYPFMDDQKENPSIVASNNNITWVEPTSNPIAPLPVDKGFQSDGHIFMRNNVMEMWFRATTGSLTEIFRMTTTDGINWTSREKLFDSKSFELVRSPAIRYINNKYCMWYVNGRNIKYAESTSGKDWENARILEIKLESPHFAWHLDAIFTDGKYELTILSMTDPNAERSIFYSSSFDNVNYTRPIMIIQASKMQGKFDNRFLYKASLVKVEDEYFVYYGANDATNVWKVGISKGETPLTLGLGGVKKEIRTLTTKSNIYHAADAIDVYPKEQITLTKVISPANGFPEATGTLITDRSFPENGRQHQIFKAFNSGVDYKRYVKTDGTWSPFELSQIKIVTTSNYYTISSPLSSYPKNAIIYTKILGANASGFPKGKSGVLITDTTIGDATSSDSGYVKQYYRVHAENTEYLRTAKVDGTWESFTNIEDRILKSEGQKTITSKTIPANSSVDVDIPLSNLNRDDAVYGQPIVPLESGLIFNIYASATDTVTVRFFNITTNELTMTDKIFNFTVIKKSV